MESNHRCRVYSAGSSPFAQRPHERVTDRIRTDASRLTTSGACRYTTVTRSGDDRARTGGLSRDKRVLCSSELRPRIARVGFEPTSRAHEARKESRSSTARRSSLAGRNRTCDLRCPKPAGWPAPLRPVRVDDPGVEPGTTGVSDRRVPALARRRRSTPRGTRTRLPGLSERCPQPPRGARHGAATAGVEPASTGVTAGRPTGWTTSQHVRGEGLEPRCKRGTFPLS